MERTELVLALERLGSLCPPGSEVVLAGGAAMILGGLVERATDDGDVIHSVPRLSTLQEPLRSVAEEQGLPQEWLNDGVRAWADVLPDDFAGRLVEVGTFGNLTVRRLGRLDLLVMKFFAQRAADLEDLDDLAPSAQEVAFVRGQLPRIARAYPDRALRMELYLAQGEGGE